MKVNPITTTWIIAIMFSLLLLSNTIYAIANNKLLAVFNTVVLSLTIVLTFIMLKQDSEKNDY